MGRVVPLAYLRMMEAGTLRLTWLALALAWVLAAGTVVAEPLRPRQADSLRRLLVAQRFPQTAKHYTAYLKLAQHYNYYQKPDSAWRYLQLASRVAAGSPQTQLDLAGVKGRYFLTKDKEDSADVYARRELALAKTLNQPTNQAHANLVLGELLVRHSKYAQALTHIQKAATIAEESRHPFLQAMAYERLAGIYAQEGNTGEVLNYRRQAINAAGASGHPLILANSRTALALDYLNGTPARPDSALRLLRQAGAAMRGYAGAQRQCRHYGDLASAFLALNLPDSAGYYGRMFLQTGRDNRDRQAVLDALILLSQLAEKQGNAAQARQLGLAAADSAKALGKTRQLYEIYKSLRESAAKRGEFQQAFQLYQQEMVVHDSLYRPELAREKARLIQEFEAERRQLDIANLERGKVQQEARLHRQRLYIYGSLALAVLFALLGGILFTMYRRLQLARSEVQAYINLTSEQNARLQDANRTKDKLFNVIAHDLRGPVAGFQVLPQMMEMAIAEGDVDLLRATIGDLRESGRSLTRLLESLLTWAQSQTGTLSYSPEPTDLTLVFEEQVRLFAESARAKNIRVTYETEGHTLVRADRPSLETVLRNLVNNAIKFSRPGTQISLHSQSLENTIQIVVRDQGRGIPAEQLPRLFAPGHRNKTLGTAGERGTGLGLVLVYELVRHNQGTIEVSSTVGVGTTFTIHLPAAVVMEPVA